MACEEWWWSSQDNLNIMYSLGIMVDSITHIAIGAAYMYGHV